MKSIVFIPVETKVREYDGKLLLAYLLVEDSYICIIGPREKIRRLVLRCKGGILIDKDITEIRGKYWRKFKENGGKIYAFDEEGLILSSPQNYLDFRVGNTSINELDGMFAWGKHHEEILRNKLPENIPIYAVGNPRIDILDKRMRKLYQQKIERYRDTYGDYIMINLNYVHPHFVKKAYNIVTRIENRQGELDANQVDNVKVYESYKIKMIDEFIFAIKEIARRSGATIIIRPHPQDILEYWEEEFAGYSNIFIKREGEANPWNMGAKMLIHQGCTTAIEAYYAGIPSIAYLPVEAIEEYEDNLANEVSLKVTTVQGLVDAVDKLIGEEKKLDIAVDSLKIDERIENDNGVLCAEKVRNILDKDTYGYISKINFIPNIWGMLYDLKYLGMKILSRDKNIKFPYVEKKEIKNKLQIFEKSFDRIMNISVKKINGRTFVIKKKS